MSQDEGRVPAPICAPNSVPEEPTPRSMALVRSPPARAQAAVDASLAQWQGVTAALLPIVGQRGVLGLFRRSVALCLVAHPGKSAIHMALHPADDLQSLRAALLHQPATLATAANDALLQTFVALLGSLIGAELGMRLIGDFLTFPSGGPAADESPP